MPKYVYSSTLTSPAWTSTTVVSGDLAEVVARLKRTHERDIVVHGSTQLAQALIDRDLADEVRLMVFPLVLGAGRRLFGATTDPKRLRLTSSQAVGDGVALLTYQPQR
jgi:dihydrofolate reductase